MSISDIADIKITAGALPGPQKQKAERGPHVLSADQSGAAHDYCPRSLFLNFFKVLSIRIWPEQGSILNLSIITVISITECSEFVNMCLDIQCSKPR